MALHAEISADCNHKPENQVDHVMALSHYLYTSSDLFSKTELD